MTEPIHPPQYPPGGPPGSDGRLPLLVCAPLRVEARAVKRGLRDSARAARPVRPSAGAADASSVLRTGYGSTRAANRALEVRQIPFGMLAITGTGAGLAPGLSPGDLVVATEVAGIAGHGDAGGGEGGRPDGTAVNCPSAPLLAGELRRAGLRARAGKVATVGHLVRNAERERLAAAGMIAADMESAPLAAAAGDRPVAVIRAISDTADRPLLRPGVLTGGLSALRSLRAAGPVLDRWAAACGPRRVLLAGPRSFCAGVERAIEIVERVLDQRGSPVYVRKQIVHNTHVVADLEQRGAIFVDELDEVPDGAPVVFSAHGVSPAVRAEAAKRELSVVDATCPLVAKVHTEARRFAADGYLVALIGHAGHEEVEGTLGEAPESMVLVETPEDVAALRPQDDRKVAYLMQTTLAADEAAGVASALIERFPGARGPGSDDICYATTNRQQAVRAVAAEADLVLVAGSANSSNSRRLVETAERAGTPAHLIDGPEDIQLGWLAGVSTIGLTAGASAPPAVVSEIIDALGGLGPVEVAERVTTTESIRFSLPKEVRRQ
ncbi:MAG TPA: 4-hydroxy-3-methylbut-2-enyl diphosphate reductase [Streptosporangiaceae bacterium]|nr:4-hydroxy-3-methylbut-2-enyl diphosphate reductase [Streptosporangiaceae bacterium]